MGQSVQHIYNYRPLPLSPSCHQNCLKSPNYANWCLNEKTNDNTEKPGENG